MSRGPVTYRAPHLSEYIFPQEALSHSPYAHSQRIRESPYQGALHSTQHCHASPTEHLPRVLSWLFLNELSSLLASGTPRTLPRQFRASQPSPTAKTIKGVNTFSPQQKATGRPAATHEPSSQTHYPSQHPIYKPKTPQHPQRTSTPIKSPTLSSMIVKIGLVPGAHCTPKTPTS